MKVAALYVATGGCYFGLPDVDPWDEKRDARLYAGPHSVVAHPPCQRWSMMAAAAEGRYGHKRGDDGGTFAAALTAVRVWGGVLEHPASSAAWVRFGVLHPPRSGGWVSAGFCGGWTCHVEQGHYGHQAAKPTWLYAHGIELPSLRWGPAMATHVIRRWRSRTDATPGRPGILKRLLNVTPLPFRDLLLSMARTARPLKEVA